MLIQYSSAFLLTFLVLARSAAAQVPFPDECPKVTLPTEFNLTAYMGVWYEYSKYPAIFEIAQRCMQARYEDIGNGSISVINSSINRITENPSNITGTAKVLGPAQLAVVFNSRQTDDKANYLVLGTDYSSYSVVFSCSSWSLFGHTEFLWILVRERKPPTSAVDMAMQIIQDNGLSKSFLLETNQDNCSVLNETQVATTAGSTTILPEAVTEAA